MHSVLLLLCVYGVILSDGADNGKFPDKFLWGTATASYQIEGAWNVSGKGENIWDRFTHTGGKVFNNDTGDIACDSYYRYKDDVKLMKAMNVSHYRYSISWARIFPDGTSKTYNQAGMDYYKNLTQELIDNNITPMATLYHWDLPQALEDVGGWLNASIVEHFKDYSQKCFEQLGDKVKYWITFNEPWVSCWIGYGVGAHAPGKSDQPGVYPYQCAHNIIKSHAEAWHLYNSAFRGTQKGRVSITLNVDWSEPKTNNTEDVEAAKRAILFKLGWFAHPIYLTGDYPQEMKDRIGNKSQAQNFTASRLPSFTDEEKRRNKGTFDFFGLNHYTTRFTENNVSNISDVSYVNDWDVSETSNSTWPKTASDWLLVVPWGIKKLLLHIKTEYNNPEVIITENGMSDKGELDDQDRIQYYDGYLNNTLQAINENCKVIGYTAWSLLDNFEWARGYSERFGLHYVNFSDPARPRIAKRSVQWFREYIGNHSFVPVPTPPTTTTTTPSSSSALVSSTVLTFVMFVISKY